MNATHALSSSAQEQEGRPEPNRLRLFFAVWGHAWLLTFLGGGACGAVCAGVLSLVWFFFTIPGGMYLGLFLGLPLGLVIAIVLSSFAAPPRDPALLTRRLEGVGSGITVLITVPINIWFVVAAIGANMPASLTRSIVFALGAAINGVFAVYTAALVGQVCGGLLAARHVRRFGLTPPPPPSLRERIARLVPKQWLRRRNLRTAEGA